MKMVATMEDEDALRERNTELVKDRIEQAKWYESLNLFGEAMRIYKSIKDEENLARLRSRIADDYRKKASDMEKARRYQDAANLYYIIGDNDSVRRMKEISPNLVILYDEKAGGISQLASDMDLGSGDADDRLFNKPNDEPEQTVSTPQTPPSSMDHPPLERTGLPVRMPKKTPARFCPYCGEQIQSKKEARFCPSCGEEL